MPLRYDGETIHDSRNPQLGRTHVQALPIQCNTPVIGEYRVMGELEHQEGQLTHPGNQGGLLGGDSTSAETLSKVNN